VRANPRRKPRMAIFCAAEPTLASRKWVVLTMGRAPGLGPNQHYPPRCDLTCRSQRQARAWRDGRARRERAPRPSCGQSHLPRQKPFARTDRALSARNAAALGRPRPRNAAVRSPRAPPTSSGRGKRRSALLGFESSHETSATPNTQPLGGDCGPPSTRLIHGEVGGRSSRRNARPRTSPGLVYFRSVLPR